MKKIQRMMCALLAAALCLCLTAAMAEGGATIAPAAVAIDVNALPDGIYPVSFDRGEVSEEASGIIMNGVHVFTRDWYDPVDISMLKVGDTLIVEGDEVPVLTLEEGEYGIAVNEEQDARAFYLVTEEDTNGYYIQGMNDLPTFTEQGVTSLIVDPAATFTDAWDIDSEPVTVAFGGIIEAMKDTPNDCFIPDNTTVRIEGGKVVEISRAYMP